MPKRDAVSAAWLLAVLVFCQVVVPGAFGLAESTGPGGSNVQAVHSLGELGRGVNVGLISAANARITHEAFKDSNGVSHAFWYDFTDENLYEPDSHDTWVAGIVTSRGGPSHPAQIGVAPDANIHSAKVTRGETSPADPNRVISLSWLADALNSLVNDHDCRVIVTGIALYPGPVTTPNGRSEWTLLYDYYAYQYNVLFANAAGKDYTSPTVFGDAYNGITTGGLVVTDPDLYLRVGSNSNSGPTIDGRRKPDVVAPSQYQTMPSGDSNTAWYEWTVPDGATSLSTPHTAGVAALLLGLADKTPDTNDNRNEVIKAVIVNSTFPNINDKDGNTTSPAEPNNVWHPHRGYGRIDALRAYRLLASAPVGPGALITQQKGWTYATITQPYEQQSYFIHGLKNHRLVMTITWNRRVGYNGGTYVDEQAPKFNLDLTVIDPNGQTLFAETGTLDNLEKVDLPLHCDGTYQIAVKNGGAKTNRAYSFAFELLPPIPGDFYPANYIIDLADMAVLARQWMSEGPDLEADLSGDGFVNALDLLMFVHNWLRTDPAYY